MRGVQFKLHMGNHPGDNRLVKLLLKVNQRFPRQNSLILPKSINGRPIFTDWSYEREWRLIRYDLLQLNADSQQLKMPRAAAIYAGALCNAEQLDILRMHAETLDVPWYLMKIDYIKRKLFYEPA